MSSRRERMSSSRVASTPTVLALSSQSPDPSQRAAAGRAAGSFTWGRSPALQSSTAWMSARMASLSKLALVMVTNRL